jgi:hypothetical protein
MARVFVTRKLPGEAVERLEREHAGRSSSTPRQSTRFCRS